MIAYSSNDDKIKDAIKFLKIGIKNNEATVITLSKDIEHSYFQSQMVLQGLDINKLQNERLLKITYSEDWYFPFYQNIDDGTDNKKNTTTGVKTINVKVP